MLNENIISNLKQSLRQTRNAQTAKLANLREVEIEADNLRKEIQALEDSAMQIELAIDTLTSTVRPDKKTNWKPPISPNLSHDNENYQQPFRHIQNQQNYVNNPVAYINSQRNNSAVNQPIEALNQRFADRTITQACTLILREFGRALHVNELYNILCSGGFSFSGNNPTISIAVSLNRNRRFRKVAPGTFDLIIRDVSQVAS
jgi:hypothetical protein